MNCYTLEKDTSISRGIKLIDGLIELGDGDFIKRYKLDPTFSISNGDEQRLMETGPPLPSAIILIRDLSGRFGCWAYTKMTDTIDHVLAQGWVIGDKPGGGPEYLLACQFGTKYLIRREGICTGPSDFTLIVQHDGPVISDWAPDLKAAGISFEETALIEERWWR